MLQTPMSLCDELVLLLCLLLLLLKIVLSLCGNLFCFCL
jgi:hypothetical protein